MHTHHAVHEAGAFIPLLAPGTGLLTQVPAIVSLLWRMDRQLQGVCVCVCVCVIMGVDAGALILVMHVLFKNNAIIRLTSYGFAIYNCLNAMVFCEIKELLLCKIFLSETLLLMHIPIRKPIGQITRALANLDYLPV